MAGSFSARVSRAIRARTAAWGRYVRGPTCAKTAEPAGKRINILTMENVTGIKIIHCRFALHLLSEAPTVPFTLMQFLRSNRFCAVHDGTLLNIC